MDHQASNWGYLIPISLTVALFIFPYMLYLSKKKNNKKDH